MKCPICQKEMEIAGRDVSDNFKTGQKYNRTVYNCEICDTWGNTEVPVGVEVKEERIRYGKN